MRPYYDGGSCLIYHGDCREVLPTIFDVDLVVTSPPYNLGAMPWKPLGHYTPGRGSAGGGSKWGAIDAEAGARYNQHDDAMPWSEYVEWQRAVLTDCWNTLATGGAIFYNHKPRVVGETLWTPLELNPGLPLRQIIVWARPGGHNFMRTAYVATYEWIMVFARPAWRVTDPGIGDVWRMAPGNGGEHPAEFPYELPQRAIQSTAGELVLDPMMGTGMTLRAAKDAGRSVIGIEIEERYCEIAARRLAQEVLPLDVMAPTFAQEPF